MKALSSFFGKKTAEEKKSDFKIEDEDEEDDAYIKSLQINLSRLIAYAESADVQLQREVRRNHGNIKYMIVCFI